MISVLFVRASLSTSHGKNNIRRPFGVAQSLLDDSVQAHLEGSGRVTVETLQVNLQPYYPHGAMTTHDAASKTRGVDTFAVNLPIVREVLHGLTAILRSLDWARRNAGSDRVIFLMTNFPPVAFALQAVSRLLGLPRVVTLTDLASFSYSPARVATAPWWKRPWVRAYARRVKTLERSYDGYVLLTRQMSEVANPAGRPHVVVEGILNTHGMRMVTDPRLDGRKVIAHAGTLDRLYGIGHLLDAFACIDDPNVELWLFGTGDMDEEITQRQRADSRIKFHGFQPRTDVFEALQRATLLVNLRDPKDEYTKYSFPSKLFEYMASATPVATTSLSGIPQEYEEFLFHVEAASPDSVAQALERLLALPDEQLRDQGARAREFVVTNKTAESQCPRIEDILIQVASRGVSS